MVARFLRAALATAVTVVVFGSQHTEGHMSEQLQIGDYYKPSAEEGSGVPNTTAAFRRAPCPALNSLANHGHLPRNGQNIPKSVLKAAVMNVFNMADDAASAAVNRLPDVLSLDFVSRHGLIEHDASMVHTDAFFGFDPMAVNMTLADDVLARADPTGKLNIAAIAQTCKDRAALCESSNPNCTYGETEKRTAFSEAALLLLGFGHGDFISADHARSFLVEERIPSDYVKPTEPYTAAMIGAKVAEMQA